MNNQITFFEQVTAKAGKVMSIDAVLNDFTQKEKIEALRQMEYGSQIQKGAKNKLPAFSTVITGEGKDDITIGSSWLIVDVDAGDNPNYSTDDMKAIICPLPYVYYCGLSCRGKGVFAAIPIPYTIDKNEFKDRFVAVEDAFLNIGLTIDKACKNVNRLRFVSYDYSPYFNKEAITYTQKKSIAYTPPPVISHCSGRSSNDVERQISKLEQQGVDITFDYRDWLSIGFALYSEFGENGRTYYHRLSRLSTKYNTGTTDRQYTNCGKSKGQGIHKGTLFYLAKQAGVLLKEDLFKYYTPPCMPKYTPRKRNGTPKEIIADGCC